MRVEVLYEANGVQTMIIDGPEISTEIMPEGYGLVVVRDEEGTELRAVHFGRVYRIDKDKT